eukprot:TRINITY_DN18835_c0_g1_i1.p3 TRINITY_DN18835_c0_g1~~TRINITY_DN18835_c0_g1_i1.p3  ORF type:complete len:154 (+),score=19.65 TRINITY_DN18835_c0_g1_i1:180-641(+)
MEKFDGIDFVVQSKADALYPIVSAASIVAKVTRDQELYNYSFPEKGLEISRNWGCGYPSDPDTRSWLYQSLDPVFGYPRLVRFSWQTAQTIIRDKCIEMKFECEAEEGDDPNQQKLEFGSGRLAKRKVQDMRSNSGGRHGFFKLRKIQRVEGF